MDRPLQQQQQVLQRSSSMPLPEAEARRQRPFPLDPHNTQLNPRQHHPESHGQMYQQQQQQQQHNALHILQSMTQHPPHPPPCNSGSYYHNHHHHQNSNNSAFSASSSSRAKCDQVLYEAIAKACEIAVRGRCTTADDVVVEEEDHQHHQGNAIDRGRSAAIDGGYGQDHHRRAVTMIDSNAKFNKRYSYGRSGSGGTTGATGSSNSSSRGRFNIEVDEVHSIRHSQALASWREFHSMSSTLHYNQLQQQQQQQPSGVVSVPLRLDIYYEYDSYCCDYDSFDANNKNINNNDVGMTTQLPPQRELLERWCIDYSILLPPSTSPFSSSSSTSSSHQHQHNHHYNRSSSSPYASPSSSPYSSIVMTGARPDKSTATVTNTSAATSNTTSQLRRVCRRIVVLLRSLHCMTRMLPAYRLRCLLLSNNAHREYDAGGGFRVLSNDGGGAGAPECAGGWGTIGYSLHIAAASSGGSGSDGPEPLPSPSFAVRSFPMVPTPYGHLSLSVMYDATLDPQRMVADVAARRGEWMMKLMKQQQIIWEQQQQQQQLEQQELEWPAYQEQHQNGSSSQPRPEIIPTYSSMTATPHIPIAIHPQDYGRFRHHDQQQQQLNQQQHNVMNSGGGRERNTKSFPTTSPWLMTRNSGGGQCIPPTTLVVTPSSLGGHRMRAVSDFIISDYHSSSTPPQHHYPAHSPSFSSSLKFNPTINFIGDNHKDEGAIRSYKDSDCRALENTRVMSGLSLAMMNDNDNAVNNVVHNAPEHRRAHSANEYGRRCLGEIGHGENVNDGLFVLPFGSPASRRAAFHTPPPPLLSESPGGGDSGTHFFRRHGGYGYGYNNGSNLQFGNEQKYWDDRILPSPSLQSQPESTVIACSDGPYKILSYDASRLVNTPPLANRVMKSNHERSGSTPPNAAHWSRSPSVTSPIYNQHQQQPPSQLGAQVQNTSNSYVPSIALSMSVQQTILPPITSLDMLQKSPFIIASRKTHTASSSGNEAKYRESDEGSPRQNDEMMMFLSSIPRMVPSANNGERSDYNISVSNLGDDPPSIPIMPTSIESVAVNTGGGCSSSNGPYASGGCTNIGNRYDNNIACRKSFLPQVESEHLPFAGDEDDTLLAVAQTSSSSPAKSSVGATTSRSLWGSTKADVLDCTLGGGMAEIATSLAVSSLHHRCATDGKIRLKMFEGVKSATVEAVSKDFDACGDPSLDVAAIRNRLSDFRSFGDSLMVGSTTHHEESK